MRFFYTLFILVLGCAAFAQNSDEELAAQYYGQGEYDKALVLYKKLYKEQARSVYIYDNYLNTLLALQNKKQAVSLVKKQIKKDKGSMKYKVDLGFVYSHFSQDDKATKHFENLITTYVKDERAVSQLAQAFIRREYITYAVQTYEQAIETNGLQYYWMSLLNLYRHTGDYKDAVDLGLEVLKTQARHVNNVNYQFSRISEEEDASTYLQQQLLSYSQRYPDKDVYPELLMNLFIQKKKYNAAYRQAKSIDIRKSEKGNRILNLAKLCVQNEAYDVAEDCYQYLIDKGPRALYYIDGRVGLLNSAYLRTVNDYQRNDEQIAGLVDNYVAFLSDFGYSSGTASSMKRLAELYLFYSQETKKAISVLNELIIIPRISPSLLGETKLMLGDAYLIDNKVWDARLFYGQVDKEFKEDPLGREAKFRIARLSYFIGDFDWANDQLEILKMATTQLIANNALELALLIQDNTGLDSTEEAMKEYAHADFLLFQNKTDECMQVLNMLPFKYAGHSLTDEVLFLKGRVKEKLGKFDEALVFYEQVYQGHQFDILADNALYQAAEILYHVQHDPEAAFKLYETLILEHTSSLFVVDARKKFEEIKNNRLQ